MVFPLSYTKRSLSHSSEFKVQTSFQDIISKLSFQCVDQLEMIKNNCRVLQLVFNKVLSFLKSGIFRRSKRRTTHEVFICFFVPHFYPMPSSFHRSNLTSITHPNLHHPPLQNSFHSIASLGVCHVRSILCKFSDMNSVLTRGLLPQSDGKAFFLSRHRLLQEC